MANGVAQKASTSGSRETLVQEVVFDLEQQQRLPALVYNELAQVTAGGDIGLNLLQMSEDQMTIKGTVPSTSVLADFMRKLESSSLFQQVELSYSVIRQEGEQSRDFRIDATLDPSPAAPVEGTSQAFLQKFLQEKKEIPFLLDQIQESLGAAGLKIYLFQPKTLIQKNGYTEVPVFVEAVGGYQHGMAFAEMVRQMDRFVTLRDIEVYFDGENIVKISATVVTYTLSEM
jgi:hypothetical protein